MIRFFSLPIFTLASGLAYAAAVFIKTPLFRYYPAVGEFVIHDIPGITSGPAMLWYGWIAASVFAGVVLSAIIPARVADRIAPAVYWIVPFVMLASAFYREKEWFLQ